MHFMNNKRETTTFNFDAAAAAFFNNNQGNFGLNPTATLEFAEIIASGNIYTNKDEYLDKVIKKYTIYDNVVDNKLNFKFFNEMNEEINIDSPSEILKLNNFYSFSYFGNSSIHPFRISININNDYDYEYASYDIKRRLIKRDSIYIVKSNQSITFNMNKGITFVLNIKQKSEKNQDFKFYKNLVSYYSNNKNKCFLNYATSKTVDLINLQLSLSQSISQKPIEDGDIMKSLTDNDILNYDTTYKISNLDYNVTLKLSSTTNIYKIYHITENELITTLKDEYIIKPNETFLLSVSQKIKEHTNNEIQDLAFDDWKKIKASPICIRNNKKVKTFISLNEITFDELKSQTFVSSFLHDWKFITVNSYEEKKEEATKIMNELQKYYKYIVNIRLVFDYDSESISYLYYNKDGNMLLEENSKELIGKYILLYPYYHRINEDISDVINVSNDDKSTNLRFMSPLKYNIIESLNGDVLINKIRIQTNDNAYITIDNKNVLSWIIRRLFIWNDNKNIVLNNNNIIISGTSNNYNINSNVILNDKIFNDNGNLNNQYTSGIEEILDNEKQYLEIKLDKPILYNNIQQIFIQTGLNKLSSNGKELVSAGNINNTSLLFYDKNNNLLENYTIDFSKIKVKNIDNIVNVDNIYLLKGPAYESYSENAYNPLYEFKPTTFATNYLTSDKIMKLEDVNNITMYLVN